MPVANIQVLAGRPRPQLKQLLREVAATYADILDAPVDRVQVWITEVDPELVAVAGVPADELLETRPRREVEIPFVRLVMMAQRPASQVDRAINELTAVVARVLDADPARVRVEVQPIDAARWGIGGIPAAVVRQAEIDARMAVR